MFMMMRVASFTAPIVLQVILSLFTLKIEAQRPLISASIDGSRLSQSGAFVPVGSTVTFTCSFSAPAASDVFQLYTLLPTDIFEKQAQCLSNDLIVIPNKYLTGSNRTFIDKTASSCSQTELKLVIRMDEIENNFPSVYRCGKESFATDITEYSANLSVTTFVYPTSPEVQLVPQQPKENGKLNVTCTSIAKPPPQLQLSIGNEEQKSANIIDTTLPRDKTELVWLLDVNEDKHGAELKCMVVNWNYGDSREYSYSEPLDVIYGPNSNLDKVSTEHNIASGSDPDPLNCSLNTNPMSALTYQWYRTTSGEQMIPAATSLLFNIPDNDYGGIREDGNNVKLSYKCVATNTLNDNKSGTKEFEITISFKLSTTDTVSTTPAKPTPNPVRPTDGGTKTALVDWQIALIAVAGCLVLIAIIVAVFCFVQFKRKSQSPKKKKAAAAREDRGADNMRYQASTSSLHAHQPDIVRNSNYSSEAPTLPADYRLSQSQPNVEQYAEALDDKPRSRKPIALEDFEAFENGGQPPSPGGGPPAYTDTYDTYRGGNYPSYNDSYGAAC